MAEEEEVLAEIEALEAVYGENCEVLERFPPHIHLQIKPRTADVSSEQFVEALISIKNGSKYPDEPPDVEIVDSKGLDEERKGELLMSVRDRASELAGCLMLVALCEEAVEKLSSMNHPEGDCPLCLCPLFPEDEDDESLPFMKLMSCFHCFHSECILEWWNWLQSQNNLTSSYPPNATLRSSEGGLDQQDKHGEVNEGIGTCPVCRKVFHTKDFEHVLNLVGTHMSQLELHKSQPNDKANDEILHSESEKIRRQEFEALLKKQEEINGLIEPPKDLVVLPGMYLPPRTPSPATVSTTETVEVQATSSSTNIAGGRGRNPTIPRNKTVSREQRTSNVSLNKPGPSHRRNYGTNNQSNGSSTKPGPSHRRNYGTNNQRAQSSLKPAKQWVQKTDDPPT